MEKRKMAGDYEILQSVRLGGKEVLLGYNPKDGCAPYMTSYRAVNFLGDYPYPEAIGGNDYLEIMLKFLSRVQEQAKVVAQFREKRNVPIETLAPLKDRNTMRRFCELRGRVLNPEEAILPPCGFSIHTKNYQYMLRCIPRKGDYNFYLYCYDKEAREQERTTPQKNTRPIAKKRTEPER